ncbi:MFS transporter, partial [Acidithiobacillus caldus]
LAGELYPVNLRTTGHGLSAGTAKVGAFLGALVFPILLAKFGLHGTLMITFFFALAGLLLTAFCLKEPSGRTLEDISGEETTEHLGQPDTNWPIDMAKVINAQRW